MKARRTTPVYVPNLSYRYYIILYFSGIVFPNLPFLAPPPSSFPRPAAKHFLSRNTALRFAAFLVERIEKLFATTLPLDSPSEISRNCFFLKCLNRRVRIRLAKRKRMTLASHSGEKNKNKNSKNYEKMSPRRYQFFFFQRNIKYPLILRVNRWLLDPLFIIIKRRSNRARVSIVRSIIRA